MHNNCNEPEHCPSVVDQNNPVSQDSQALPAEQEAQPIGQTGMYKERQCTSSCTMYLELYSVHTSSC